MARSRKPRVPADGGIPHEVVALMTCHSWTPVRAWREYLGVTQIEMAARLGIRQPSYRQMEAPGGNPKRATLARIAEALGIQPEQLDLD
jgi:predicted transcriptional regulator